MSALYTFDSGERGKFGDWFRSNWKRVAATFAPIILGPVVGGLIAAALILINQKQSTSNAYTGQFSPEVEAQLNSWALARFDKWTKLKVSVFSTLKSKPDFLNTTILKNIDRSIIEIASLSRYYAYMATISAKDRALYEAKSIVMNDFLNEFVKLLEAAYKKVGVSPSRTPQMVDTVNVSNGPDIVSWNGQTFKVKVTLYGGLQNVMPGDPSNGGNSLPPYQSPPFNPNGGLEVFIDDGTIDDKPYTTEILDLSQPVTTVNKPTPQNIDTPDDAAPKKVSSFKTIGIAFLIGLGLYHVGKSTTAPKKKKSKKVKN